LSRSLSSKLLFALGAVVLAACTQTPAMEPTPTSVRPSGRGPGTAGIRLTAAVRADGAMDVIEIVVLRSAVDHVPLDLPPVRSALGALRRSEPSAVSLRGVADGRPLVLAPSEVREAIDLPMYGLVTRLELRYRLTGATVRSKPSRPRRALAVVAPLTASADPTLPTTIVVTGAVLLNAFCPRLAERLCAVGDPPRLSVRPRISAQYAVIVL
jgi:hypothetical protein